MICRGCGREIETHGRALRKPPEVLEVVAVDRVYCWTAKGELLAVDGDAAQGERGRWYVLHADVCDGVGSEAGRPEAF